MSVPGAKQASQGDYWKQKELERGHLFPNGHASDEINAESTYTLTNTVPQESSFNKRRWRDMEQKVRDFMHSHCRDKNNPENILAYVLTGAVPGSKSLNERVNVPSYMWTAFCCYNVNTKEWESQTHWAENKKERNPNPNPIPQENLQELEEFLREKYKQSSLFSEECYNYFIPKNLRRFGPIDWFLMHDMDQK